MRTTLGLAAVFLTVAIPVRLGLHGITLGWALEGLLLLALGLRYGSLLARAGAYGVLTLAAVRLLARHTPWTGAEAFTPVFNAGFGTWAAVIAALAAAALLSRRGAVTADRVASVALSVGALVLLFGLLSGETANTFDQAARLAQRHGDLMAAPRPGCKAASRCPWSGRCSRRAARRRAAAAQPAALLLRATGSSR